MLFKAPEGCVPEVGAKVRPLAEHLWIKGKLRLEEAFVDATFAGAKKGASPSARPVAAKAQRFSLSPLITVFHSRYLFRVLPRTNHNWWKRSWQEASSMNFQRVSLGCTR
jgi:hypothetical protein